MPTICREPSRKDSKVSIPGAFGSMPAAAKISRLNMTITGFDFHGSWK